MRIISPLLTLLVGILNVDAQYEPNWKSLDSRPIPQWYDDAKIGVMMNLGPYSVTGIKPEWFSKYWTYEDNYTSNYMSKNYPPNFTYQEFGPMLKMEFFDADKFAEIVKAAGAKYFIFTSKHSDGFVNCDTSYSVAWNSMEVGPKRDVIGELKTAFQKVKDIHFGVAHTLMDWFNPLYLSDRASGFKNRDYVDKKLMPELKELIEKYKPDILWTEVDWEAEPEYWRSQEFLAWLYNESPSKKQIVVSDMWGKGAHGKHGGFFRYLRHGSHKFEDAISLDRHSWGYRPNMLAPQVRSLKYLLKTMIKTVARGGNFLMNVGPTSGGIIPPIFEERLRTFGAWLNINGEAIYGTKPWVKQNEFAPEDNVPVWYTSKGNSVFAIFLSYPQGQQMTLSYPKSIPGKTKITMPCLGPDELKFKAMGHSGIQIEMPGGHKASMHCLPKGRNDLPFVIKLEGLATHLTHN